MSNDGILGITNRTENWTTARYFAPFFEDEKARLRLAKKLGAPENTKAEDVRIELFWKGIRDWVHCNGGSMSLTKDFLECTYENGFGILHSDLTAYVQRAGYSQTLKEPQGWNYRVHNFPKSTS